MRADKVSPSSISFAFVISALVVIACVAVFCPAAQAQDSRAALAPRPLITQEIDESQLTTLKGNTHPLARPEFDLGTAQASLPVERMLLVLKRSPEQETALRQLMDEQQDQSSPNYHKWLTPEQFGKQFGPTDTDMQTITAWLQSHGFQVGSTKGRTVLEFSGSASQVQEAFQTTIHKYLVNGEQHWANASDPQIPTALTGAVAGVMTLHNFIKKPTSHFSGERVPAKLVFTKNRPQVTFPPQNGQPAINALAPQDYAVIYNINPLYNVDNVGNGTSIAVVGRSNLFNSGEDIQDFFNTVGSGNNFNRPNFSIQLNGPDPGDLGGGEEAEATLDSTWSGALAPGANVSLIVSATTNTTDGIDLSELFIVENNYADIMTESFSSCELYATDAQLAGTSALAQQAAAQGITYTVSTGDNGAEGCDDPGFPPATNPISVNLLASTAFNVAVGGTMFNENGDPSKYWASTPPISETALSYIPEEVWNESSPTNGLWSSSGGASAGNIQSGAGTTQGVPKPSWQFGVAGILPDVVRDLPDVSLTAAGHDPYLLCFEGSCVPNAQGEIFVYFISGTSASAPSFAGIMALIEQAATAFNPAVSRIGLPNYVLYRLAATQSSYPSQCNGSSTSTPPASGCVFNDITVGNNVVPGEVGNNYQAGAGYDMTTGLGSVNVGNLYTAWNTVTFNATTTTLTLNGGQPVTITHGQSVTLQATVAPTSGTGTPTGDLVLFTGNGLAPSTMELFGLSGAQVISSTNNLPGNAQGSYNVWAHYGGDSIFAPSDSQMVPVTVSDEPSTTTLTVLTLDSHGNQLNFTGGPFGSFVYLRADVAGQSGHGTPTGTATFTDTFGPIPAFPQPYGLRLNGEGDTASPNGILNFDAGAHTISASYGGDPSFSPSSTTQSQTFTITPGFYVAIPSAQALVVISSPGAPGSSSISVSNSTNFSGTISFACAGLPSESSCVFNPTSVTASGTANTTTVGISVTTTAPTALLRPQKRSYFLAHWMIGFGLLSLFAMVGGKRQQVRRLHLLVLLTFIAIVPACGGGGSSGPPPNPGTPTGQYNVTVTATSGTTSSTTGFVLAVK